MFKIKPSQGIVKNIEIRSGMLINFFVNLPGYGGNWCIFLAESSCQRFGLKKLVSKELPTI